MGENVRIMAVSLVSSKQRTVAYAVFNGEQLSIVSVESVGGGFFSTWRDKLIADIQNKVKKGFIVIVEERTDLIAQHATQYMLEDVNDEGRTNMQEALDWYFSLESVGNLIFSDETKRYHLSSGAEGAKIDTGYDDKGRPVYKVDWNRLPGGFRSVLLCVVAAMTEPLSERFLTAMFGNQVDIEEEDHPVKRWKRIFKEMGYGKEEALMEARGQR